MIHGARARRYHETTKHSRAGLQRPGHMLDWENKPAPFKTYRALEHLPLPRPDVPALEAIGGRAVEPVRGPGAASLARPLLFGAGVHHRVRFPDGDSILVPDLRVRRLFGALCLVTGNRQEAEELAQGAFLRVWERW